MDNKATDKLSDLSRAVNDALSLASSKKEWIGKQLINGFLLFIILLVFGCLDFATLKFHFEFLITISYWSTVGAKVIAGICAYNIGINIIWETEIKKDVVLAKAITLYNKLLEYMQLDFEYFVEQIFNPLLKKQAYIASINKKINKLNKFSKPKDRLLYSMVIPTNAENYDALVKDLEYKKSINKYCIKRQELEDLKSEEFIKNNLDNIEIKYTAVDPSVFQLEIDGSTKVEKIKVKGNVSVGKINQSANVALGMLGFSMFFTSISLDVNQEEFANNMIAFWHYLLKTATDVGVVLWQLFRGILAARKIISREITQVYNGRNRVLERYIEWRLETNQPNSKIHDELSDENVIEMTQEEFDKLKKDSVI